MNILAELLHFLINFAGKRSRNDENIYYSYISIYICITELDCFLLIVLFVIS